MKLPSRLILGSVFQTVIAITSVASAQTWNDPTRSMRILENDKYGVDYQYYNWQWVDPGGVNHSFPDYSEYIQEKNGYGRVIDTSYGNLINDQASDGSSYYLTTTGTCGKGFVTAAAVLLPKFQVVSVIYAPPGSQSSVDYSTGTTLGTSTSVSSSFASSTTLSATVGVAFFNLVDGTTTYSASYNETVNSSTSIALTKIQNTSITIPGPANSLDGINHDYDIILVCLNPKITIASSSPPNIQWTLTTDTRDTAVNGLAEIIPLYVYQLKNPSSITDSYLLGRLQRSWAGPGQGLTSTDFAEIAARDPFWNDTTTGSTPAANNPRFQLVGGATYAYAPPPPGGQPITEGYTLQYQNLTQNSKTTTDTFTVSSTSQGDVNFFLVTGIGSTSQLTWTNLVTTSTSNGSSQGASFSLTGPTSQYTGPAEVMVYQDVIYGTFLFCYVQ